LEASSFSYADFYARRIKRIFPALVIVLAASCVTGWFWMQPEEYKRLGQDVISGGAFFSNLALWKETGYFDAAAETKPLLHLWSLAVEEQFYVFWPLLLGLMWRRRFNFLAITLTIAVASFALNVATVNAHPGAAFYSPLSRFWELMAGSVLAYLQMHHPKKLAGGENWRSLAGAGLVVAGIVLLDSTSTFPGWAALLPVLGAFLLLSAPGSWLNRAVLGNAGMRSIGLISYPLYLWHWPILYAVSNHDLWAGAGVYGARWIALAVAFCLSAMTYLLVEKPIRFGQFGKQATFPAVAAMAALVLLGTSIVWTDGFSYRSRGEIAQLAQLAGKYPATEWRDHTCFLDPQQDDTRFSADCAASGERPSVFLWGDSYAAALYPGLLALQANDNFRVSQYTASACPPLMNVDFSDRPFCADINRATLKRIAHAKPQIVLLGANWAYGRISKNYNVERLQDTVSALKAIGVPRIVVVGPMPQWERPMPSMLVQCASQEKMVGTSEFSRCGLVQGIDDLDRSMEKRATSLGVSYASAYAALCNKAGCLTVINGAAVSSYDVGHLTPDASRYAVQKMAPLILAR
jgi:peptidoglycan/LPS O-acetylase OafA/YrhL